MRGGRSQRLVPAQSARIVVGVLVAVLAIGGADVVLSYRSRRWWIDPAGLTLGVAGVAVGFAVAVSARRAKRIVIPAQATSFDEVCADCLSEKNSGARGWAAGEGTSDIRVSGELPLDQHRAWLKCPSGHQHLVVRSAPLARLRRVRSGAGGARQR